MQKNGRRRRKIQEMATRKENKEMERERATNDSAMCKHTAKDVAFQFILLKLTREFFKPPVSLSKCALLN